jgi:broad specificity phosphatase PhoE
MARVFLIRHGEPSAHWSEGANDPGLSARGHEQAEAAGASLVSATPLVISSPLVRCQETASPLARMLGVSPLIEPRVAEVPAPDMADRTGWLQAMFPGAVSFDAPERRWEECGAEILAWRAGVVAALSALDADTAVFTHFIAINAAVSAALSSSNNIVFHPAHASVSELANEGGVLRVVRLGAGACA